MITVALAGSPFNQEETATIREHRHDCVGYVVAATGACLEIKTPETWGPAARVTGRKFQPYHPKDLATLRPPRSWFLGVVLCPGDAIEEVIAWYRGLSRIDRQRVKFYVHPDLQPPPTVDPDARAVTFEGSWQNFHRLFGRDHGDQILADDEAGLFGTT